MSRYRNLDGVGLNFVHVAWNLDGVVHDFVNGRWNLNLVADIFRYSLWNLNGDRLGLIFVDGLLNSVRNVFGDSASNLNLILLFNLLGHGNRNGVINLLGLSLWNLNRDGLRLGLCTWNNLGNVVATLTLFRASHRLVDGSLFSHLLSNVYSALNISDLRAATSSTSISATNDSTTHY